MSDHDPLCPPTLARDVADNCMVCNGIREIRADERERIAAAIEAARDIWLDNYDRTPDLVIGPAMVLYTFSDAARVARGGGSDE